MTSGQAHALNPRGLMSREVSAKVLTTIRYSFVLNALVISFAGKPSCAACNAYCLGGEVLLPSWLSSYRSPVERPLHLLEKLQACCFEFYTVFINPDMIYTCRLRLSYSSSKHFVFLSLSCSSLSFSFNSLSTDVLPRTQDNQFSAV